MPGTTKTMKIYSSRQYEMYIALINRQLIEVKQGEKLYEGDHMTLSAKLLREISEYSKVYFYDTLVREVKRLHLQKKSEEHSTVALCALGNKDMLRVNDYIYDIKRDACVVLEDIVARWEKNVGNHRQLIQSYKDTIIVRPESGEQVESDTESEIFSVTAHQPSQLYLSEFSETSGEGQEVRV